MKLFLKNNIVLFLFFVSSLLVIIISITANISARRSVEMMEQSIKSHLTSAAAAASHLLSAEELDVYRTKADTENPAYERLRQRLMSFAEEHQVLYVYYWRDNGDNRIQYIIDNDTEDSLGPDNFFEMEDLALLALSGQPFTTDLGEYSPTMEGLLSALAPVFDSKGRVSCVAGVDISDELIIKQRKVTLNRYIIQTAAVIFSIISGWAMMVLYRKKALQSQSANAAKGLFLSTVSHEIRTPMNAIIGISELALREETSPAVSGYLKNIQHAGSNLLSIINDILDFSKIESGRLDIIKQAYNLDSFLSDVINIVRVRLDEKPLRFVVNIDDSLPTSLIGDESRVRQVLLNLLSNAIKYTQEGGLTFSVSGELLSGRIIMMKFSVSDTGIGIKECDLHKLFSTFVQLDMEKNRGIEGTGLGLAITHKLCHMMGGNVTVESDYGKGSTFTAVIPQEIFDPAPIEGRVIDEITNGKFSDTRTSDAVSYFAAPDARVLVVDDVPLNLVVAEGLLSLYKMQIDCCENGIKAIELIKKNGYDMVLMDHIMPEMDGMEAVANIRGLGGEYTKLPIIALTANAMTGMKNMFLENGFNDYLSKPIDVVKLDEVVRNWIPESKMTPG